MTTKKAGRARSAAKALGDLPKQLAALDGMTVGELAAKHLELFGEPTRSHNRGYLVKRLAWRIQELAEGGLTPPTLARVTQLGDELPERWRQRMAPPAPTGPARDPRLPPVGTVITREFHGQPHAVKVLDDGFEYAGETFKSLSAIARKITGTAWNGFAFFGLKGGAQ